MSTPTYRLPSLVRTRLVTERTGGRPGLERVNWLTPYTAEMIAEDARRAGPGTRLELTVPPRTSDSGLAAVERLFAWLREAGIEVRVTRGVESGESD